MLPLGPLTVCAAFKSVEPGIRCIASRTTIHFSLLLGQEFAQDCKGRAQSQPVA